MTERELEQFVKKNIRLVGSKTGMVNRVRGHGHSASMARIYKAYNKEKNR